MFGQSFEPQDFAVIGILIVLEGVLSIDNALVLGILARRVRPELRARALSYGLIGALVFRLIAVGFATVLMEIKFAKVVGGLYLVYIAAKYFLFDQKPQDVALNADGTPQLEGDSGGGGRFASFWPTVVVIELTDIAFAVDSILAAVGLVNNKAKTWVVLSGGMLGVVLMRFAAALFIKLLERFPRFETAAYLLVVLIGAKLIVEYFFRQLDFHHPSAPAFWVFWGGMFCCFCVGFIPDSRRRGSMHSADVD